MWDFPPDDIADSPSGRARRIILDDSSLSNREVSLMARCTPQQVERVRRSLIDLGLLMPRRLVPTHIRFKELPRSPRSLQLGACVGHPRADFWTSADHTERQVAIETCRWACPVLAACREWSLSLPAKDTAIYAAMTASQRDRERRRREGRPEPGWVAAPNAARTLRRAQQRALQHARAAAEDATQETA